MLLRLSLIFALVVSAAMAEPKTAVWYATAMGSGTLTLGDKKIIFWAELEVNNTGKDWQEVSFTA